MKKILTLLLLIGSSLLCFSQESINVVFRKITSHPPVTASAAELQNAINELQSIRKDTLNPDFPTAIAVMKYLLNQEENRKERVACLNVLLDFSTGNPILFGSQTIPVLKTVPSELYDSTSLIKLTAYLNNPNNPAIPEALKVAGSVGGDRIFSYLQANAPTFTATKQTKWPYALAMAHMSDTTWLSYCLAKVKKLEVNAQTIYTIYPDLAYTRQKVAVDFLVSILMNNSYTCDSPNAESTSKIDCGYRIMEILAPVVTDFPYKVGASGDLIVTDYKKALVEVREWFRKKNGNYAINKYI